MPLRFHPLATGEAEAAFRWYRQQSVQAADGFYEELLPAFAQIQTQPQLYPAYLYGTRRLVLHHYPFSVIFRICEDNTQVVAVAHAKRRPGYWRQR